MIRGKLDSDYPVNFYNQRIVVAVDQRNNISYSFSKKFVDITPKAASIKSFDDINRWYDNKIYNRPWLKNCTIFSDGELVKNLDSLIKMHSRGGKLSGEKSLIIIDDCSADQDLNKHRSALSKISFFG